LWSNSAAPSPPNAEAGLESTGLAIERFAEQVVARRMEVPAILAIEMHRPLAFLGSQALVLFTPLLAPAFGLARLEDLTRLLEDPRAIEALMLRIEELSAARDGCVPEAVPATTAAGESE
jgi:hypothetical protein